MTAPNGDKVIKKIREDLRFWIFIGGFLAVALVWAVRLEAQVNAMQSETRDKGAKLRQEVEAETARSIGVDKEILEKLDGLENNQIKIMTGLGIE